MHSVLILFTTHPVWYECCITYPPGGKLKELCIVADAQLEIAVNIQVAFFKARRRGKKYSFW